MLEKRKEPRFLVNKQGVSRGEDGILCLVNVNDQSDHGIGFTTTSYNNYKVGDMLYLKFAEFCYLIQITRKNENDFGGILVAPV